MKNEGTGIRDQGSGRVPQISILRPGNASHWRRCVGPAVILLAAAVAVAPQLVWGNSCGHDFDFHLVSWFDALNAWRHGLLYPHWTPSANYGAGEPRFVFYSPLTWMLGAALGAVLPWTLVAVALTFLLLAGTGLATRVLARQVLGEGAATLAGCAALFSGYALFTAYERSAFAELAGGFWIPLVLLYAIRKGTASGPVSWASKELGIPREIGGKQASGAKAPNDFAGFMRGLKPPSPSGLSSSAVRLTRNAWRGALDGSIAPLAVAVAGAWLSNPTVGLMACYLLAAVALVLVLLDRSWAPVLRASAGALLGMGLAAIYLVPATWEQRWVDIHQVTEDPGQTLENNWLFAIHADPALQPHDLVLHTVSMIVVIMIAVTLGGLLVSWLRGRLPGHRRWWIPLSLIPAAVLFLQFPFSRPLWNLLPDLRFLQFPWRWLVVLEAPMAIFVAAAVWPRESVRPWRRVAVASTCIAVFLGMTVFAGKVLYQSCEDEDAVPGMLDTYRSGQGFIGTNEYEPLGADNSLLATDLPQACLVNDPETVLGKATETPDSPPAWDAAQESCEATFASAVQLVRARPEHLRIVAATAHPGYMVLRLRRYPAWQVKVNGLAVASLPRRADGLIAVPVPQGRVDLTVDWTTTPDVILARWLSGLSVLMFAGLCWIERKRSRTRLK
ncbi:MAG TPA: 6-pyruvoyl-tetrahydropterin synthase-related protein [Terracidiphilus sp.]|nr:6-pyruvoyl-tetrahydropterin synthase-related protein [Terracidiphilus sp.]